MTMNENTLKEMIDIKERDKMLESCKKTGPEYLNNTIEFELDEDQQFAAKVLKKYADYVRKDAITR